MLASSPVIVSPQDLAVLYNAERKKREELEGALQLAAKELTTLRASGSRASSASSAGDRAGSSGQGNRASEGAEVLREQLRQAQQQSDNERRKREELEVGGPFPRLSFCLRPLLFTRL